MEFDFSSVYQKPNLWFSTQIVYEGEGEAEFLNPHGKVRGHTVASLGEDGQFHIEMSVEGMESDKPLPLGLNQLLSADDPFEVGQALMIAFPSDHPNMCVRLTIKTSEGTFFGEESPLVLLSETHKKGKGSTEKLTFYPKRIWFESTSTNQPLYWSVPLINFVADFIYDDKTLDEHPLRVFPPSVVPSDVPEEHITIANRIARQKSKLIVFDYHGEKAFIERLPDYQKLVEQLKGRQIPHAITAMMIVPLLNNSYTSVDEVEKWFPQYLIDLLEISTGNEVEAAWIEFRDSNGKLVKRVHRMTMLPLFLSGTRVLDELRIPRGIGKLLESSQNSPHIHETFFRVILRHTVLAGRNEQMLEDKFDHLFRALETLCEHYGFKTQNLLAHTTASDRKTINQELIKVVKLVEQIRQNAEKNGDMAQARLLGTVQGRINNVANQDRKFGLAVCDLLSKFEFRDADVIDEHYTHEPRKDGLSNWADVISVYRGSVIHFGFFNVRSGDMEIDDIVIVMRHLHDILVRIIFTLTGYTGDYLAETIGGHQACPVNWVQKDTPVENLGYKKRKKAALKTVLATKD